MEDYDLLVVGSGINGAAVARDAAGPGLSYLQQCEWARSAEDVRWRRTKCGLAMSTAQRARVAARIGR